MRKVCVACKVFAPGQEQICRTVLMYVDSIICSSTVACILLGVAGCQQRPLAVLEMGVPAIK